jgi:hypothetical protein
MHGKDFWPTKLIYFPHTASIIFQGCNNCSSNINNIYRLDSANKTLLGIEAQKVQKGFFFFFMLNSNIIDILGRSISNEWKKRIFF